jgi:hypothetical protein
MIEHLKIGRAAYFYKRKKALSDNAVTKLFTALRKNANEPSRNLFREVRVQSGDARYSAICFDFARQPSFLDATAKIRVRVYRDSRESMQENQFRGQLTIREAVHRHIDGDPSRHPQESRRLESRPLSQDRERALYGACDRSHR